MEASEQEAINNLNDMSSMWLSDCVDVNLKSLSNNLVIMSEDTHNSASRAKQFKQKGKKQQSICRPMSQQRSQNVSNPIKRHSLSINQESTSTYDFQQQYQQQQNMAQNNNLYCSLTHSSGQSNPNPNISNPQSSSFMIGSKKTIQQRSMSGQPSSKTSEFLSSLITPAFQKSKKDHYQLLIKLREKERVSRESHQELVLYGNSQQQQQEKQQHKLENIVQNNPPQIQEYISAYSNENLIYSKQNNFVQETMNPQLYQQISVTSTIQQQHEGQISDSYHFNSNTCSKEQETHQKQFNMSINSFQKVFDKTQHNSSQNIQSQQQNQPYLNNNPYLQQNSFRPNGLIENSSQFLIKLKSRFSRAASCYRKKTPLKNQNQSKEMVAINIPNPQNIYTKSVCAYDQYSNQSNSALQLLKIIPTPLSTKIKTNAQRKITISSQSDADIHGPDDQPLSQTDKKSQEIEHEEKMTKQKSQCIQIDKESERQGIQNEIQVFQQYKYQNNDDSSSMKEQINNVINNSFIQEDEQQTLIIQSHRQSDNTTLSALTSGQNSQIAISSSAHTDTSSQKEYQQCNKIDGLLNSMQVMGHKIKQNVKEKKPFSSSQNKENLVLAEISHRQQSVSMYGGKSMNNYYESGNNNQSRILSQQCQNYSINNQNNSGMFSERQQNYQKESRLSSATQRKNSNSNCLPMQKNPSNSNNSSHINLNQMQSQTNKQSNTSASACVRNQQHALFEQTAYKKDNMSNQNNSSIIMKNTATNKYNLLSNRQSQMQSNQIRIDIKMMQGRNLALNYNENNPQKVNHTRIFDDEELCKKVNNLLCLEMSTKSLIAPTIDKVEHSNKKIEQSQNKDIQFNVSQNCKRNTRQRQNSVDLSYSSNNNNNNNNISDLHKINLKKKENNHSQMLIMSAKFNKLISKDTSISTPRYLPNNPSM